MNIRSISRAFIGLMAGASAMLISCAPAAPTGAFPDPPADDPSLTRGMQTAVLAGQISYGTILKVFFSIVHDPTQLNYQGPDHGTQYRSAIFYANPGQKAEAEGYIEAMRKAKTFSQPIVTQVVPLRAFYAAEDYHQHFMVRNPNYPYILMWDRPKVAALLKTYGNLVASRD